MNGSPMSTGETFDAAAELLMPEGMWTTGNYARNANRDGVVNPSRTDAVCFCMVGAVARVRGVPVRVAEDWLSKDGAALYAVVELDPTRDTITQWNDAPGRTQPEVVSALRKAAALARTEEAGQ